MTLTIFYLVKHTHTSLYLHKCGVIESKRVDNTCSTSGSRVAHLPQIVSNSVRMYAFGDLVVQKEFSEVPNK